MIDERDLIHRLEAADPEALAQMLRSATADEEKVLRIYLGDAPFQRLRQRALRVPSGRGPRGLHSRGNVVVLPGLMGSELSCINPLGAVHRIWLNPLRLLTGQFSRLQLAPDGLSSADAEFDARPTGIFKRYYSDLLLALSVHWNVRAFWYDWRKDLRVSAAQLDAAINGWFPEGEPVHIVAHSMGGMVARVYLQDHPHRWKVGGRLVMLGTPNRGSFAALQALTGCADVLHSLAMLDLKHDLNALTAMVDSFPGLYQLQPSPSAIPAVERLYDPALYSPRLSLSAAHLQTARQRHLALDQGPFERMIYIAGCNQPTVQGVDCDRLRTLLQSNLNPSSTLDCFEVGVQGDGTVPHALGLLPEVPTYYIDETHSGLSTNSEVLDALDGLLETGHTTALLTSPPAHRGGAIDARSQLEAQRKVDEKALESAVHHLQSRSPTDDAPITAYEREISEIVMRSIFAVSPERAMATPVEVPFPAPTLEVQVLCGNLMDLDAASRDTLQQPVESTPRLPIDAIAVGQYQGDLPTGATLALDRAISHAMPGGATPQDNTRLLLTGLMARGILRGNRGEPFFLPDPRVDMTGEAFAGRRLIAVMGLGSPGQLGIPELSMVVRELCWSLGWMGQQHLATQLIGAGAGNLSVGDAVSAWMRGAKNALTGIPESDPRRLMRLTFVENNEARARKIDAALRQEAEVYARRNRFTIHYQGLHKLSSPESQPVMAAVVGEVPGLPAPEEIAPLNSTDERPGRLSISLQADTYSFGAVTDVASIPERSYALDRTLVEQANDQIAAASTPQEQLEHGQFLAQFLIPKDLRREFNSQGPLVLMLDAAAARIHWEVLAPQDATHRDAADLYLGSSRGLTRQLRTVFAPAPDPAPPANRILRVLVVANPDGSLPWAEEEGAEVARLFEAFNTVYASSQCRVEVVKLFGVHDATRLTVLREIIRRSYDVLHYAGHCVYVPEPVGASGWLFGDGERLSARELSRLDRVPSFIFSNACESGVTPDRSGERTADLAPSFAEAFFAQGVSNFVCTAWPVEDEAASRFAIEVYSRLLGLEVVSEQATGGAPPPYRKRDTGPQPMYTAMREARRALFEPQNPSTTWGAYQHYGNPFFRLFQARLGASESL